jgi:DNA-binding XRE family transcriptional regulator
MATQELELTANRRQAQAVILAYRRLPQNKKARVEELMRLLQLSNDLDEQEEIAMAVGEILVPQLTKMNGLAGETVDLAEGVPEEAKQKVDAYRKHVGRAIKRRRGELQMTQDELADKAGLLQSHISRLEDGKHAPTAKTIERLAKALETEPARLDPLYE